MYDNRISDADILRYAVESGIIDTATISENIMRQKRNEILKKHPCQIWQGKTDGKWYTHIRENGKRRLIKRNTREQVEDAVIDFMERQQKSVRQIFTEWLQEKKTYGEIQKSTCDRYEADFKKYFGEFGDRRIDEVTEIDIERFIKDSINTYDLTNKAYSGLRLLLLGLFTYAKKHKLTEISIQMFFKELCLSSKIFRKTKKKASDNVFMTNEVERIIKHLLGHNPNVISYGIVLALRTGLRVGELSALTPKDIHPGFIEINKTEIRYRVDSNSYTHEVRANAKTDAGNRQVIIDEEAERILHEIYKLNPRGEYLFEINGKRCIGQSFTRKLERACETIGIKPRSMHKCRKTYATNLINANVPESFIIAQMGHIDISTTKNFYLYDNTSKGEAVQYLQAALPKVTTSYHAENCQTLVNKGVSGL